MTLEWLAELALLKEQNAQLVKERDAAIADIEHSCEKCRWETISGKCSHPTYCEWEWRGVRNADS